jgi:hypothetical protein
MVSVISAAAGWLSPQGPAGRLAGLEQGGADLDLAEGVDVPICLR